MPDLLFEIGTEELPSWYIAQARSALQAAVLQSLADLSLGHGPGCGYASPRRLAVIVEGVVVTSEVRREKRRGPAKQAAYDSSGKPTRAAHRFAASNSVGVEELVIEETERGAYVFALREVGGERAADLLAPALSQLVADLPAPRKMRWGEVQTPFVRPVHWLVALLGTEILDVEAAGVKASNLSYGHRFLMPAAVTIKEPTHYVERLRAAEVIVDVDERSAITRVEVDSAAALGNLVATEDAELLEEVTNLVERPLGVLGAFDEDFLELPEEVLKAVMIDHQRFFPTRTSEGCLAPFFVAVSNNLVPNTCVIRKGYEQVLEGRLHDARFFWRSDCSKSLAQHARGLSGINFHRELGTMAAKIARVGETAQVIGDRLELTEAEWGVLKAVLPIFRADLATGMVAEFPELEGGMARAYAVAEGLDAEVAEVLEQGTLPKGPFSPVPGNRIGALLSVLDRIDKLVGFFAIGQRPTGSTDPYGLRRDAVAVARTLNEHGWEVPPKDLVAASEVSFASNKIPISGEVTEEVCRFLYERVASLLAERGVPQVLTRAAAGGAPPIIMVSRRAVLLSHLLSIGEFPDLMALYKRASNLAREAGEEAEVDPKRFLNPAEGFLHAALPAARRATEQLLSAVRCRLYPWDLARALPTELDFLEGGVADILALKAPLDTFLDNVLVMVDDPVTRENRLALLREVRDTLAEFGALENLEGVQV
ncbi:MAG: glycine--tRNA ligase subunit beta [Truepera sp.]|nr:glycine--tRNA ligase subunit beta [Truepera sp.]